MIPIINKGEKDESCFEVFHFFTGLVKEAEAPVFQEKINQNQT